MLQQHQEERKNSSRKGLVGIIRRKQQINFVKIISHVQRNQYFLFAFSVIFTYELAFWIEQSCNRRKSARTTKFTSYPEQEA